METAHPALIPSSQFNFDNDSLNRQFVTDKLNKLAEVIEEDDKHIFFRTGSKEQGWYIGYHKQIKLAYYCVQYQKLNKRLIGQTVTQTLVWRGDGFAITLGITNHVIFDILLPRYGAILSDSQQTREGQRFWRDLIARADDRNLYYGLVDFNTKQFFLPEEKEHSHTFWNRFVHVAYGSTNAHRAYRFLISDKPIVAYSDKS